MWLAAPLLLLVIATYPVYAGQASRQAAVNKAIEQTKSRLTAAATPLRVPQRANVRLNGEQLTTVTTFLICDKYNILKAKNDTDYEKKEYSQLVDQIHGLPTNFFF
uniref:Uncharacterized protein n=1 Tax=Caenorhabditis japonica TaxID=281687 RepID=A0A8R1EPF1_CAEJA